MKIAIDLNDVIRAYTSQFASYYKRNIDRSFDIDNVDVWTNKLNEVFPFGSKQLYLEFLYNDCAYEIFGCAQTMHKNTGSRFTDWCKELSDMDEVPNVLLISTGEYDKTIGATHFFLSKIAPKTRETQLLLKDEDAWSYCDVMITANPFILSLKPEDKISIKIDAAYNTENESDFSYDSFMDFLNDTEIIEKLNNKLNNKLC